MIHSSKASAQYIRQLAQIKGIKHVIFSPGSRNAPLIIELGNNPDFECLTIPDERSAAFIGLGITLETKLPCMMICTSGSALLNYYPAVAEAFYQRIPMIIVSADRPSEWVDQADGQTIRQQNVFANHILYSTTLFKDSDDTQAQHYNQRVINEAFNSSIQEKGPVHINIPFEEPLYDTQESQIECKSINVSKPDLRLKDSDLKRMAEIWNGANTKMILIGQQNENELSSSIQKIAEKSNCVVLSETTSNVSIENSIETIDRVLDMKNSKELSPEILITTGGAIVSKKIKQFLRTNKPLHHWHVSDSNLHPDTFQSLTESIKMDPTQFFKQIEKELDNSENAYLNKWLDLNNTRREKHSLFLSGIPYCDLKVFELISQNIPKGINIHWSNSTSIRYSQLFEFDESVKHFCNRGTSGIDGSNSTAVGHAIASGKPTLLITGDVSFLYDSNAFFSNHLPNNLKIILVNNSGGGIFRFIPGPSGTNQLEEVFESKHNFDASGIAKTFNIKYRAAKNASEVEVEIKQLINEFDTPTLLEIFTPSELNAEQLKNYFSFLQNG